MEKHASFYLLCPPELRLCGDVIRGNFPYTTAAGLPKEKAALDLQTKGRDIDWELPQTNLKEKKNLIWLELSDKKRSLPKRSKPPNLASPSLNLSYPTEVKAGEILTFFLGTPLKTEKRCVKRATAASR